MSKYGLSRYSRAGAAAAILLCCFMQAGSGHAVDLGETVQVHGFLSQAASLSSDNDVGGSSSDGVGLDLREIGANISWRPDPDWLVSAQALMRWAGETDEGDLRLDYGFVDRNLISGSYRLGVQLGKIKSPYGFYNTTRDVAHTRPGVILPQSIYLDRVRDFVIAGTGLAFYGNSSTQDYAISWQLNGFQPEVDSTEVEYLFLGSDQPGSMDGEPSWMGQVMLDLDGGRWLLGATLGEVVASFNRSSAAVIGNGTNRNQLAVLSMARNSEHWSVIAEYAQIKALSGGYGFAILDQDNTLEAWYVQGTWRIRPEWQVYLRRDELYLDKDDRDGQSFSMQTGGVIPAYSRYAKDWTLGMRYDIGNWALFAEAHILDGTAWLSPQDTPLGEQVQDWNLLLLQAAYRF